MIRILQVVNVMDRAGLETMIMNYYRHIDREKIQFDFLVHRDTDGAYDEEIKSLGGRIFRAPRLYPQNYLSYFKFMKEFFKQHVEYRIIHSHIDSMSFFPLLAAKLSKVPVRIAHSHTSKFDKDFKFPIKFCARALLPFVSNKCLACGKKASLFMFNNSKAEIINNAVDLNLFSFKDKIRIELRDKLNLTGKFVIGHVGRFCYVKNQLFLLEILKGLLSYKNNAHLVLIGKGEDEQLIRNRANELGLTENISILIDRKDVCDLYNVFDVFVMPSLFEGLPMVGVEAQANGLPCVFSDSISKEVLLSSNASFCSLSISSYDWAKRISEIDTARNKNALDELKNNKFDIVTESSRLQKWYLETANNCERN